MTMKPPVEKLLPLLQREALAAVEKFAEIELKPDVVRVRIYEAARTGQRALRIALPGTVMVDMRPTVAAAQIKEWCEKSGLTLGWESRTMDTPDGRRVTVYEPEISW